MTELKYSAGMVSKPFWFHEFSRVIELLHEGNSFNDIRKKVIDDNIFLMEKEYRALEIYNKTAARAKALPKPLIDIFCGADLGSKKCIAILAVMLTDKLFFEFMYEVYREKILIGMPEISTSEIVIFFKNKQMKSPILAAWKDYTLKKLSNSYMNYMVDSGLASRTKEFSKLTPPLLDIDFENCLIDCKLEAYLYAITGVK